MGLEKEDDETHIAWDGIRDGNDRAVSVPALLVRPQPTAAVGCRAFGVLSVVVALRGKEQRTTVDSKPQKTRTKSKMLLTLVVRLPRLDDGARNGLAARGEHAALDIHVLSFPFRRDRLSERDCGRDELKAERGGLWGGRRRGSKTDRLVRPP